jgi:hypothetical protein
VTAIAFSNGVPAFTVKQSGGGILTHISFSDITQIR